MIESIYEIVNRIVEEKCRSLIKEHTGEEAIPEGTKIRLMTDISCAGTKLEKGQTVEIEKCIRFEEKDVFRKGWYAYKVKDFVLFLYPYQFEIVA
jgi:hypothetical protein